MTNTQLSTQELVSRLEAHPHMREQIASLLTVVDDAEERVIEEIRRMGQKAMQAWDNAQVNKATQTALQASDIHREGKKTALFHHIWTHKRQ